MERIGQRENWSLQLFTKVNCLKDQFSKKCLICKN